MRIVMLTLVLVTGILTAATTHAALLITDGAEPVAVKHGEVELNGSYACDTAKRGGVTAKSDAAGGDITITAGMVPGVDLSVTLPATFSARERENGLLTHQAEGMNDTTLDMKIRFVDHDGLQLTIKPVLILPTGRESVGLSDGRAGFAAALLATQEFTNGTLVLHANGSYERHNYRDGVTAASSRSDLFFCSVAGEAQVAEGFRLAVDLGVGTNGERGNSTPLVYALTGGTYELGKQLEVYAGIKVGLTNGADDITGLAGVKLKF
jgi:hypothetical protein